MISIYSFLKNLSGVGVGVWSDGIGGTYYFNTKFDSHSKQENCELRKLIYHGNDYILCIIFMKKETSQIILFPLHFCC